MSFQEVCRGIGQFISDFLRIILFFASLIFLVISALMLYGIYMANIAVSQLKVDDLNTSMLVFKILAIYLIVLAIVGVIGSFYASKTYMKCLASLTSLNVIIAVAVILAVGINADQADSNHVMKEMKQQLQNLQQSYDFDGDSKDKDKKSATVIWDSIQVTLQCCGYENPDDWNKGNVLPKSCCKDYEQAKKAGKCSKDSEFWGTGCKENILKSLTFLSLMIVLIIGFNLLLALMSCLVLMCRPSDRNVGYNYS